MTTTATLSPRGAQLQRALAMNLQLIGEHDKVSPAEVDTIVAFLVQHVRSWRPQALIDGAP
jgi:hypothetical protein